MEHKHTPGPWVICREDGDIFGGHQIFAESQLGTTFVEDLGRDAVVAEAGLDHPNYEANARLIAASPLMFDALETIAAGNTDPDQMVEIAQAALAKATAAPEKQDKPMRWPADFPGKHDKQERLKK